MISTQLQDRVVNATVKFVKQGGLGVLVSNGLILTVAHCVDFSCEGRMVQGQCFTEKITTNAKDQLVCSVAVEPLSDLAVCGSIDDYEFQKEAAQFEEFCRDTQPVNVYTGKISFPRSIPVFIYTHEGRWITGTAEKFEAGPMIWVKPDEAVKSGTSGGPIVNDSGELVAIVSSSEDATNGKVRAYMPNLALPVWAYRSILRDQRVRNRINDES